jgi:hypothetical protein
MKSTPEHIDPIFRKKLQNISTPPPAVVWGNIEHELQKRNRRVFWWYFSFVAAGVGMVAMWFLLAVDHPGEAAIQPDLVQTQPLSVAAVEGKPQPAVLTQPKANFSDNKIAENKKLLPVENLSVTSKQTANAAEVIVANLATVSATVPTPDKPRDASTAAIPPLLPVQSAMGFAAFEPVGRPLRSPMRYLHVLAVSPSSCMVENNLLVAKKPIGHCYDFSKQPTAWLLEAYFGPSLAQRELTSSPDNRPYLVSRLRTERRDLAYNVGLRAALMIKGNFMIRTGLHYDHLTELFEYIDPSYVKYLVEIVNLNGVSTIDTVGVEYGEKYQKTYNRLGMLDIPVMAGVELRNGRSGFNIHAGMSFNVLFWKRGAILAPDTGVPERFAPNGTLSVFRPRTGVSATASVQWFYYLEPRTRFFVEPYFKKVLRPVSVTGFPVQQRYGIGGVRFGCTKILN